MNSTEFNPYDTDPNLMDDWTDLDWLKANAEQQRWVCRRFGRSITDSLISLSGYAAEYWNTVGHSDDSSWYECHEYLMDIIVE